MHRFFKPSDRDDRRELQTSVAARPLGHYDLNTAPKGAGPIFIVALSASEVLYRLESCDTLISCLSAEIKTLTDVLAHTHTHTPRELLNR